MTSIKPATRIWSDLLKTGMVLLLIPAGCSDAARQRWDVAVPESGPHALCATPPLCEPYEIEMTGSNDRWQVRYPGGPAGSPEATDAPVIHVPLQTKIALVLKSTDYVYTVSLPQFGLKEIAVPDLVFRIEFRPEDAGRFSLIGDQLCGLPHPELQGQLVVEPRDRFLRWIDQHRSE